MQIEINPLELKGKYYTVQQFATIIGKTSTAVYMLITKGNAKRKLRAVKLEKYCLIPAEELQEFPFTSPGRDAGNTVYHYGLDGKIIKGEE